MHNMHYIFPWHLTFHIGHRTLVETEITRDRDRDRDGDTDGERDRKISKFAYPQVHLHHRRLLAFCIFSSRSARV